MKILTIVGARPQFIKAATVSRAIRNYNAINGQSIVEEILHTGQHYDEKLSGNFFKELEIPAPAVNLEVGSGLHGEQTGKMIAGIEQELMSRKPDCLLVYGDTNSTLAGAIAASKLHIPIAHVESGLRSYNMKMPEEVNRVLTDRVSTFLYTPTETASKNLENEGYDMSRVKNVGDVTYDAALYYRLTSEMSFGPFDRPYILCTFHRPENTDNLERLTTIISSLVYLSEYYDIVLPLHPRTKKALENANLLERLDVPGICIHPPVGYLEMLSLEMCSELILTDSGGIQKEAFFYKKPCVTLRDETEWPETISTGWNRLCPPTKTTLILDKVGEALKNRNSNADQMPYGDGRASDKIVDDLIKSFS